MRAAATRIAAAALVTLSLVGSVGAGAQEPELVFAAFPGKTGKIDVLILNGPAGLHVQLSEQVGEIAEPLRTVVLNSQGGAYVPGIARWRCERRSRRFVATYTRDDGSVATVPYATVTPSCRDRLALAAANRVRPGGSLRVKVSDRWGIGGIDSTLCVRSPGGGRRCERVEIRTGATATAARVRVAREGVWRLELRNRYQHLRRLVGVGVAVKPRLLERQLPLVLVVGDSQMQQMSVLLDDRLAGRARTDAFLRGGSGLAESDFDWRALARRQTRRDRPDVTVVLLGGADPYPMPTPGGATVECCGEGWIAEYARRATAMMRIYGRDGAGRVAWIIRPAPSTEKLRPSFAAANEAIRRAARAVPDTRLVHLDRVFTPGFRYRRSIRWRGQRVNVFTQDGIHLTVPGSSIAATLVLGAIRRWL